MKTKSFIATGFMIALLSFGVGAQTPPATEPASPPPPQVQIESRFFTIAAEAAERLGLTAGDDASAAAWRGRLSRAEFDRLLGLLAAEKSMALLSTPRVTTKSGQRAILEIIREFRYATEFEAASGEPVTPTAFETRNVGVTLEVEPVVSEGQFIEIKARPTITSFLRFAAYAGGKTQSPGPIPRDGFIQPIFDSMTSEAGATLRSEQTIVFGGYEWHGSNNVKFDSIWDPTTVRPAKSPSEERQLLFVTLTATLEKAPSQRVGGRIKSGSPATISFQLAGITRDRLPPWMIPQNAQVAVESSTSQVTIDPAQADALRKALESASGGPLLTAPARSIAPNERHFVKAGGVLRYPANANGEAKPGQPGAIFETESVDLQLAVEAQCQHDVIDLTIRSSLKTSPQTGGDAQTGPASAGAAVEWQLLDQEPRWTSQDVTTSVTIWSGSTVVLMKASPGRPDHVQLLLISATGTPLDVGQVDAAVPKPRTTADTTTTQKLLMAIPVPGKPGFVTSPYAADKGYVDVRGFPSGTEVKCPFSGQTFIVP